MSETVTPSPTALSWLREHMSRPPNTRSVINQEPQVLPLKPAAGLAQRSHIPRLLLDSPGMM